MASRKKSIISDKFKKWAKTRGEFNFRDMINERITVWRGYAIILTDRGIREGWLHKIEAVPAKYINRVLVSEAIPTRFRWSEMNLEKITLYASIAIDSHIVSEKEILSIQSELASLVRKYMDRYGIDAEWGRKVR